MTAPDEIEKLIARVESARGPDRELDADIAVAVGGYAERHGLPNGGWVSKAGPHSATVPAPGYTSSLDAVVTLVPEGFAVDVRRYSSGNGRAIIWHSDGRRFEESAANPALAASAAALRAHQQSGER